MWTPGVCRTSTPSRTHECVTEDGHQWPGVLRRRTWDAEAWAWRWDVDVWLDGRRVSRQLGQDQIELVPDPKD